MSTDQQKDWDTIIEDTEAYRDTIATVDATGVVTGVKDGATTLTAVAGALKAEVKVEVTGLAPAVEEKTAKADKKGAKGKKK